MSKHRFGFDYCALRYLNMWLETERGPHQALNGNDEEQQRNALTSFAAGYRIARNLPKKYESGSRFQPVLDIFKILTREQFDSKSTIEVVKDVSGQISKMYKRKVLSLTTKFLWLKFRSPVIIYDRQAREALGTDDGDIDAFYIKWRDTFHNNESDVTAACSSLPIAYRYTTAEPADIAQISSEQWFKERVFDMYLWSLKRK
jgi:hypothetical protein